MPHLSPSHVAIISSLLLLPRSAYAQLNTPIDTLSHPVDAGVANAADVDTDTDDAALPPAPEQLRVRPHRPAFFYPPKDRSKPRPVILYLHGRGAKPADECALWAELATSHGWLLCPSAARPFPNGGWHWANDWGTAHLAVMAAFRALKGKFGADVLPSGNAVVGFSEGAYVAMNVGIREPETFSRWLILAGSDDYFGPTGRSALSRNASKLHRVCFATGDHDPILPRTILITKLLTSASVSTKFEPLPGLGHELAEQQMHETYAKPLAWIMED